MKLRRMSCIVAILLILVAFAVAYTAIPGKTIFEITGWSTNSHDYVRITMREIGVDDGIGVRKNCETEDKNLIKEILEYLSTYELKTWYKLVANYVFISDQKNITNYQIVNKDRIDQSLLQGLLQKIKCDMGN